MNFMRKNIYVVDTCVLINEPDIFSKLGRSQIVIPTVVIKELDGMKRNPDPENPRAKAARQVSRLLDKLGSNQDIAAGAKTASGSTVRIAHRHVRINELASNADNRIVGTALKIQKEGRRNVILLSSDCNLRNICRSYGISAMDYPFNRAGANRPVQGTISRWDIAVAVALIMFVLIVSMR